MQFIKSTKTLLAGLAFLASSSIQAHTPYLVPMSFDPVMGSIITLDASFAERFFIPEAAFAGSEFSVTAPDGSTAKPDSMAELKTRVVVEHKLEQEGTYRITTGTRMGAEFLFYELNGEAKRTMNPKEPLPEEAKVTQHFQSVTRADTYVTRKKVSSGALQVEETGLQILPVTHPNELYAEEALSFKVLFDNQPLATKFEVYPAGTEGEPEAQVFETNKKGEIEISLPAGQYLIKARHRAAAPKSAKAPTYSHTTTLSILVFDNI